MSGTEAIPDLGLVLWRRGKVRDTYQLGDRLLMVATDRVSAYDCVLPTLIPDKGRVLTAMSRFWFERTRSIVPNHLLADDPAALPEPARDAVRGRALWVRLAERVDVECVVRSRLAGSGWAEVRDHGTLAGEPVPAGLGEGDRLPTPRFTPAVKHDSGHDVNISRAELRDTVGEVLAGRLESLSLACFAAAQPLVAAAGFDLVDTKFEFGWIDGALACIDECLTPDSSRFWDRHQNRGAGAGFDKQRVRDYLAGLGWDRTPPAPPLPPELVAEVRHRYREACRRITGIDVSPTSSSP
ncbi:MAG TPA: phosphoribosylaminoimidazolesuccinocarboxamide synthase [Verrucomicrobiae bacterium]|nr:phosphoribosylaminoimidazolesuccinocarboxamide synthase [Verrucomicrobiae bacterium]